MTTSTHQTPPEAQALPEERRDRTARRLLKALLVLLLVAALGLAGLLVWLLRPEPEPTPPGQAAGYPIHVVATIYGFGTDPADQIRTPLGVTFDSQGNVWVSDTGRSRVEEYTADGGFIQVFGQDKGPGQLYSPYGIAVDSSRDLVYVADYGARLVQAYSTSGQYVTHFPADDQDMAVFGPDGFSPFDVQVVDGRVVVSSNDGLYFFDTAGHVVARWGATHKGQNVRGVDMGMFNFPDSFVADPKTGRIYVADTLNRRIVALDRDGRWLWVSGRPDAKGKIRGFWQLPRGIQLGPDGNLYVIDTFRYDPKGMGAGHVVVLSPEGKLLSEFGRGGSDDGAFEFPEQIAFNGSDLWAVADRENHRVVIFRLSTPYPKVSDLETPKYDKMLLHPKDVFATPQPAP
jgi:DNA-binding beta-propeller fold protein YncE